MKVRMSIEMPGIRIRTLVASGPLIAALLLMSGLQTSASVTEGPLGNHRYYFSEYISNSGADIAGTDVISSDVEAYDSHPGLGNKPSRSN